MSYGPLLFQIPAQFLSQVDAGQIVRYGTILKDVTDGKIVAHLQQTGVFDHVLSNAVSGVGQFAQVASSPVSALTGIGTLVQNQQIKGQLNSLTDMVGSLQSLSLIGTVASVAGIGVTVASTAILLQRIKTIDKGIGRIEEQIAGLGEQMREQRLHQSLSKVESSMEKLAEATFHRRESGTRQVLNDIEEELRVGFNELARLMPGDVMLGKLGGDQDAGMRLSADMRELRAVTASRPSFCERLIEMEVSGPDYLAQAEERDDAPVVMLASS